MSGHDREVHFIVPLACDFADHGAALGPDTLSRLEKTREVYTKLEEQGKNPAILLYANEPAKSKKLERLWSSMAGLMRTELQYRSNIPAHKIILAPNTWGTRGELESACAQIMPAATLFHVRRRYHVVTSWYHVPRVYFLAREIFMRDFVIYSARGKLRHALHELYKLPGELLGLRQIRDQALEWIRKL